MDLVDASMGDSFVDGCRREVETEERNLGGEGSYTCPALAVITGASLPFTGTQARNNKLANHAPDFFDFHFTNPPQNPQTLI